MMAFRAVRISDNLLRGGPGSELGSSIESNRFGSASGSMHRFITNKLQVADKLEVL